MTIIARVVSWVSDVGDPFSFQGDKGEQVTLYPVYAKVAEAEVCQIFKTSHDAALEVQGILIEHIDKDLFLDVEDTGKVSAKGNKKWKLMGLQPPGEGEFIDLRKIGKKNVGGSGSSPDASTATGVVSPEKEATVPPTPTSGAVEPEVTPLPQETPAPGNTTASSGQSAQFEGGPTSAGVAEGEAAAPAGTYSSRPTPEDWTNTIEQEFNEAGPLD